MEGEILYNLQGRKPDSVLLCERNWYTLSRDVTIKGAVKKVENEHRRTLAFYKSTGWELRVVVTELKVMTLLEI